MKNIAFGFAGVLFGVILTKAEVISWFRIYEMFRFESFHMFGVIGTAVVLGAALIAIMKGTKMKTIAHKLVTYKPMPLNYTRHLLAGSIFGLGWALSGCCPGPMYALLGSGYWIIGMGILGAILGAFVYGLIRNRLPH